MRAVRAALTGLGRLWRGELPLDEAFWTWAVVGGITVNLLTSILFVILMLADQPILALLVGYGLSVPYNILVVIGVWQSAARYPGDARLAALARFVTVTGMTLLSVT